MATGDQLVQPYQVELGGLLLGPGTDYEIIQIDGLDLPALRTSDAPRASDDGVWRGQDLLDARTVTMTVEVNDISDALLAAALQNLAAVTVPTQAEVPCAFLLPGQGKRLVGQGVRVRRRAMPVDLAYQFRLPRVIVEVLASDPRLYDLTAQTVVLSPQANSGGRTYPRTYPLTYGAVAAGAAVIVTNRGTYTSKPVVTFTGPCANPVITNVTTGQVLAFAITLAATDRLTVSLDSRTVVLNGQSSRRGALATGSTWWGLAPGQSSVQFLTSMSSPGATASVTFSNAYL